MNQDQARNLVRQALTQSFDKARFRSFVLELLNQFDESKAQSMTVPDAFAKDVRSCMRLGTYRSPDDELLDVLIVNTTEPWKLERTRSALRNFVAHKLKRGNSEKDAALVAFVSPTEKQWRFSYVKMEYATVEKDSGKIGVETKLTPARRFSYIVGEGESCHTAQTRFLGLLKEPDKGEKLNPTLAQLEEAFSVDAVTKEFFTKYAELFGEIQKALDKLARKDSAIANEFDKRNVRTADFAKKLMGQIVFLYFIQKKGWLGVEKGKEWGTGPHDFLRRLADSEYGKYENFFNDILEPLFYDTLATDRGHEAWCEQFNCRIPFLNGGLFEPLAEYDWRKTDITLPNGFFTNTERFDDFSTGTGLLDMFDRYNFTVNEAEPLEKEVAIDPEMLGKVFENLIEENLRKGLGSYYTPREIVHYMCQESLINYLDTALNSGSETIGQERRKQVEFGDEKTEQTLLTASTRREVVPRADIETFVHLGDQASFFEDARVSGTISYARRLPKSIEKNARLIDDKLANITVCDPAVGSGAFLVGMMTEIVRARSALTPYFNETRERTAYRFKHGAIQNSLYGVDIDPGAVEIAKLRLWLSLVVDEEDVRQIKPLPNLDFKVVTGNSLLSVDKDELENWQALNRLEKLKPKFFDEPHGERKQAYKQEISDLMYELTKGNKTFDFEIYFSEVFHLNAGFDVLIANPPYGADIPAEQLKKIMLLVRDTTNRNSAALFIDFAKNRLVHKLGTVAFIVPKSLLYSEDWFSLARAMASHTVVLVDVEKAFENVLLEQVVFVLNRSYQCQHYLGRKFLNNSFVNETRIPTECIREFDAWVCDVSAAELALGRKLRQNGKNLSTFVDCFRGFALQRHVSTNGAFPVLGGKNVRRFVAVGAKGYLDKKNLNMLGAKMQRLLQPKVMAQNLVAHIQNPSPHVMLIAALDRSGDALNLDTVTNIVPQTLELSLEFIVALLNSKLASWYAYRFIFCSAIRTMHFDKYYVGKLLLPNNTASDQRSIAKIVERIIAKKSMNPSADVTSLEREIDRIIYSLYDLTPAEVALVEGNGLPAVSVAA